LNRPHFTTFAAVALAMILSPSSPSSGQEPAKPAEREPIRLANQPALSPDGSTLVFAWGGDLWTVPITGGQARPLTRNAGVDRDPVFSPDGKRIGFASDRNGSFQPYVMPAAGGVPRQVGFHTGGYTVAGFTPDGRSLLVSITRDHFWRDADRFALIGVEDRTAETPLFDAAGRNGQLSPDGKKLLFTREGTQWWRKGYKGSQESQVWMFDLETKAFTKVVEVAGGASWPLWRGDGKGLFYVGLEKGALNLRERDLASGADRALTEFTDDSVVYPCIAWDGGTIVFRHLFDLYRVATTGSAAPTRIDIGTEGDSTREPIERRVLQAASQVAFSKDGLEIAMIAGGDLWVMDTELKEPRQVTNTPEEERDPVFAPKGDALWFVSDQGGQADLWKATKGDPVKDWWLNSDFKLDRISQDGDVEADPKWSPDGSKVAYLKGRGDLYVISAEGKDPKKLVDSFDAPRFDWSPDGKWIVYAKADNDFNEDIWVAPVDGSKPPFNLSRHPDNEGNPVWSPDGKIIAFTGRRAATEVDIYFVYLRADEDEKTGRDRSLEKAIEKMKNRKTGGRPAAAAGRAGAGAGANPPVAKTEDDAKKPADDEAKKPVEVVIDFDRVHERIRHVAIPDSTETALFWSPDSKKLAFTGTVEGRAGVYTVELPDDLKPKLLTASTATQTRWLEAGNQIVGLVAGIPTSIPAAGGAAGGAPVVAPPTAAGRSGAGVGAAATPGESGSYRFSALQEIHWPAKYKAAFDLAWRTMRDRYYDGNLGNRNWDAIRRKYAEMAAASPDRETFGTVVNLMLGELNGSHLGFTPSSGQAAVPEPAPGPTPTPTPAPGGAGRRPSGNAGASWNITTAHFGLRFDPTHKGPGLKVRDVIPDTPADHKTTRIIAGEILVAVDGGTIDPALDLTAVLNGPSDRDVKLTVRNAEGKDRDVVLRPIALLAARNLLYDKWIKDNRKAVDELSHGKLGYLHIRGMNFPSFYKFEEELYSAGAGKDGLIIDVRENGGGSTADHLLTALTQPAHAITIPRGGGPGYPQDRRVYATWTKPIVVLCNQNSFSNAEIFAHAIKTLKRGPLVGVPTAGGVISTGATTIMDVGTLRLPGRGWFLPDTGEDMELNGARPDPDHTVWPDPADFARGIDAQLAKAVTVLEADVKTEAARPRPALRKASDRTENRRPEPATAPIGGGQ